MLSTGVRALVTGAASGLGRATAERIVASGGKAVILDLPSSNGADVAQSLGSSCHFIAADITSEEQVQEAMAFAHKNLGAPLNTVVNCAGIAPAIRTYHPKRGPHDLDAFTKVLMVNTVGTFNVCRLAVPEMLKNEVEGDATRGVLINTASIAGYEGQVGQVAYASSKGAIIGMTLPMARDLAKSQIRVMTIAPGLFLTPLLEGLGEKVSRLVFLQLGSSLVLGA